MPDTIGQERRTTRARLRRPGRDRDSGRLPRYPATCSTPRKTRDGVRVLIRPQIPSESGDPRALRSDMPRRAQAAAELRPLRWHDLRHTYGSLLAADGVDLVTIQSAMGHSALATTGRYLHARPASEQAARFTRAFQPVLGAADSATATGALGSA